MTVVSTCYHQHQQGMKIRRGNGIIAPPMLMLPLKVGIVLNWDAACGITEHTKYFADHLSCATVKLPSTDLEAAYRTVINEGINVVHIPHEYSLFDEGKLIAFINKLRGNNIKVIIDFHTFVAEQTPFNDIVDKIVVHVPCSDSMTAPKYQTVKLPTVSFPYRDKKELREELKITSNHIVATFGFIVPHKGILETMQAIRKVKEKFNDILYIVIGTGDLNYLKNLLAERDRLRMNDNVIFFSAFYTIDRVGSLLQLSDVTCLFYTHSLPFSSSGPVRICLASHRPLIISDVPIFFEFSDCVMKTPLNDINTLAEKIVQLLSDDSLQQELVKKGDEYIKTISPESIAKQYEDIYNELSNY